MKGQPDSKSYQRFLGCIKMYKCAALSMFEVLIYFTVKSEWFHSRKSTELPFWTLSSPIKKGDQNLRLWWNSRRAKSELEVFLYSPCNEVKLRLQLHAGGGAAVPEPPADLCEAGHRWSQALCASSERPSPVRASISVLIKGTLVSKMVLKGNTELPSG